MKIIFLDLDGVLNSRASMMLQAMEPGAGLMMQPHRIHVVILNEIVRASGANVVITSTWRISRTKNDIQQLLSGKGFSGEIIDTTPVLQGETRGTEIRAWLAERKDIEAFVILDDERDMGDLCDWLVQTKTEDGLLASHIPDVLKILHKKI